MITKLDRRVDDLTKDATEILNAPLRSEPQHFVDVPGGVMEYSCWVDQERRQMCKHGERKDYPCICGEFFHGSHIHSSPERLEYLAGRAQIGEATAFQLGYGGLGMQAGMAVVQAPQGQHLHPLQSLGTFGAERPLLSLRQKIKRDRQLMEFEAWKDHNLDQAHEDFREAEGI
ncbi:MAG: hypothetical protein KAS32_25050 [Candidatus Peribacteraceae bacterium]|nr:hypothetical protein [Candidatus Peribacteraceae bacterium]